MNSGSHDVQWTPTKVAQFWDDLALANRSLYFSAMVAPYLVPWIVNRAKPGHLVVDLGCGPGDLLAEFARRGYQPFGVDSSPDSLREAARRIGEANVAVGSVSQIPLEDHVAGCILLVETIEHVLDGDLEPMMAEAHRVLEPGRPLVITTPNSEDLAAAAVRCPDCHARFHPMQHVRSWSAVTLSAFLRGHGFSNVRTYETRLPTGRGLRAWAQKLVFSAAGDRRHLLAIARR